MRKPSQTRPLVTETNLGVDRIGKKAAGGNPRRNGIPPCQNSIRLKKQCPRCADIRRSTSAFARPERSVLPVQRVERLDRFGLSLVAMSKVRRSFS